jgi:hypothetical protein
MSLERRSLEAWQSGRRWPSCDSVGTVEIVGFQLKRDLAGMRSSSSGESRWSFSGRSAVLLTVRSIVGD